MRHRDLQGGGILTKLLEQGIKFLLIKECKKISNLKINIIGSYFKIISGEIDKINLIAEDINYKDLLFDIVELDASQVKINFNLLKKNIDIKNNFIINLKISLSEKSIKTLLASDNWKWIEDLISKKILNQNRLQAININEGKFVIKTYQKNKPINYGEKINIKATKGKIYLENTVNKKTVQIPIEDKIYIDNVTIEENLINIFANSSISL
tara:strand:- start:361 stop:993 length:633 start_codon:yes stop_codon:yes gene_type:complete